MLVLGLGNIKARQEQDSNNSLYISAMTGASEKKHIWVDLIKLVAKSGAEKPIDFQFFLSKMN